MKICMNCSKRFENDTWQCPSCNFTPERINGHPVFAPDLAKLNSGFNPVLFEKLFTLESENFWFRSRNKLILWAIQSYFPFAKTFFEIGCGTGFVLNGIRSNTSLKLYGGDIFHEGLFYAGKRVKNAVFFQMDASNIPFENEFDIIGAFDMLEHINDDTLVLKQMHRALNSEGGLIVTVPQHPLLWSSFDEYSRHARRYIADELKKKIVKAGFGMLRQTSFVSLLFPLLLLSRFKTRSYDIEKELRVGRRMNLILERIMDIERVLIRKGVNFPFGGSLLMISRKI